jgi:tetratricopeptide (TPR) repeat protein
MLSKEKTLLVVVVAAVAGLAAMDKRYQVVNPPATKAPNDIPPAPVAPAEFARFAAAAGRSLFDPFSDLLPAPLTELAPLPRPPVPFPVPPVRPWPIPDSGGTFRHFFFEPAEPAGKEKETDTGRDDEKKDEKKEESVVGGVEVVKPKPVDLSTFDWTTEEKGLGQKFYGVIELLPADKAAGKSKYLLLVDPEMEFTFRQVTPTDGKFMGGPVPWRARIGTGGQVGFADNFVNNYGTKRALAEHASGQALQGPQVHELVNFSMEEARKPKYTRRECWTQAAKDLHAILRASPNDKDTMKELGRVLRLLQDLNGEKLLYDSWMSSQTIAADAEVLALAGEVLELLGLPDQARENFEKSLVTRPDGTVRLHLGEILLSSGTFEDARKAAEVFRRAVGDGERVAGTVGEAGAVIATAGSPADFAAAAAILDRISSPGERDCGWYDAAGAVAYAGGSLEEARGDFQAAVEKAKTGEEHGIARTNLAIVKGRLGALLPESDPARRTMLEDAVKTADEALKDDPDNYYWPLVAKGYALRALGEKDRAVEALQDAVSAWPQGAYGHCLLGELLLRDGRMAEARTQFLECSRLAPRFPDGLGGVGRSGGGAPGEAREYLRRAIALEPRTALWPLLAARMALLDEGIPEKQRLEDARRDLTNLLDRVDRSDVLGLVALGWVLYYQGFAKDALERWSQAQKLLIGRPSSSPWEQKLVEDLLAWVKVSRDRVYRWSMTSIWVDEFKRPDSPSVGNGWSEEERTVHVITKDGAVQFGPGPATAGVDAVLWRVFEASKVLKASFSIQVAPTEPCTVEINFRLPQGKSKDSSILGLIKKEDGSVSLHVQKDQRTLPADEFQPLPGYKWPANGQVRFGFVKMNEEKGLITLLLDGKAIAGWENVEMQNFAKNRSVQLRMEVRCSAPGGTDVNCRVEAAEVWLNNQP